MLPSPADHPGDTAGRCNVIVGHRRGIERSRRGNGARWQMASDDRKQSARAERLRTAPGKIRQGGRAPPADPSSPMSWVRYRRATKRRRFRRTANELPPKMLQPRHGFQSANQIDGSHGKFRSRRPQEGHPNARRRDLLRVEERQVEVRQRRRTDYVPSGLAARGARAAAHIDQGRTCAL